MPGRVLIIAGTDPSGGAGVQADIKTVTAMGGFATSAITALVAQNTMGVERVLEVPTDFIAQQIRLILEDIGTDAVKIGMLGTTNVITAVADALIGVTAPIVVDPVMFAKSGDPLQDPSAIETLRQRIIPRAAVLTPNRREAEALAGFAVDAPGDQRRAAEALREMGPSAVLVKGGGNSGSVVTDVLLWEGGIEVFESARLATNATHGAGCTLSSAIAAGLAGGLPVRDAVAHALAYTRRAMETAPGLGKGRGPLNHVVDLGQFSVVSHQS
ncbi:MAG TPA: bifunctional hydroxymethylpyrimidine kinase/phosphomethylpyrimidine kinase [Armatimonadota bacterium]|jgi:hydroxymethylpyrimidine/phosphomethylpyrimidine kinase